jgi:hypothetical protein
MNFSKATGRIEMAERRGQLKSWIHQEVKSHKHQAESHLPNWSYFNTLCLNIITGTGTTRLESLWHHSKGCYVSIALGSSLVSICSYFSGHWYRHYHNKTPESLALGRLMIPLPSEVTSSLLASIILFAV